MCINRSEKALTYVIQELVESIQVLYPLIMEIVATVVISDFTHNLS